MTTTIRLVRIGAATDLTRSGAGTLLLEDNMVFAYDPI
jgi:hypothetical protein